MVDGVVAGAGIDVAVREFGGSGAPILLLHGAGNTLVDMAPLAGCLTSDHRVAGMDLRNHGRSGDGTWEWNDVLADIRAVVNELEMVRPIVVGHSLGGMLAAMYADRFGDAAGAVNLDGHSDRLTEDLLDPDIAARLSTLLRSIADGVVQEMSRPRSAEEIGVARARWVAGAQALGLDAALAVEAFDRRLIDAGNGMSTLRPEAKQLHELRSAVEHLDLLELYRRTAAPQLVYVATRDQEEATAPEELRQLTAAYRRALIHGLRAIAQTRRSVQLIELDATHGLIYECPQLIAGQIRQFTSSLSGSPAPVGAASQEHG